MFDLIKETPMPEYEGTSFHYVHQGTGMEVFHIRNSNQERCCVFMFNTPSEDSKGVAHILEHTVLCGSRRFPVKDPFSQVLLSSPNTFLNAITFTDKTMYPFASPLKKDFDILFDIYSDAVFDPLLRKQSFYQEGIRSFEGKYDGVVFNEMCGGRSTEDSVVQANLTKEMFRGTPYEFDSGGDPYCIPDLTYEEYLERYRKWYSPSNCRLFLFGDLDTSEYLDKLEERYLNNRQKGEKIIPKSENYLQEQLKPMRVKASCPAGDSRSVVLTWLTSCGSDPLEVLTASVLVDILLGNPGAPLYKAIMESGLGEDLNPLSGTDVDSPVLTFSAGFSHAKEGREDDIEAFLIDQIKGYVRDGLPEDAVKAAIKRLEFKIQEIPGDGLPFGIATCLKAARCWLRGKDPELGVANISRLERLKAKVAQGRYFESWMDRYLLQNDRRCLLTVESDDQYDEKFQASLQEKLEMQRAMGLMASEEDRLAYENFVNTPDSPEAFATIERITREDLPRSIKSYHNNLHKLATGARLYTYNVFTRGIVYLSLAFDTKGLSESEKRLLPLLVRAMQMCGTKRLDFTQLSTQIKMLTGSFFMYPSAGADRHHKPVSLVVVKAKMLESDLVDAMDLVAELLTDPDFSDFSRLKASLSDMITEFESGYTYSGNSYAVMNASSIFSATAMESEINMGTAQWFYLSALKKDLEEGETTWKSLSASLTKLWSKVFTQRAMKVHVGSEMDEDELVQIVSIFADKFKVGKFVRTSSYYRNFKNPTAVGSVDRPIVYTVPSGPAFNALAVHFVRTTEKDYVASALLSSVLSSGYLWNTVRGVNGAYGVESHVDGMEDLFVFSTYRDPGVKQSFKAFRDALSQELDEDEIEYAIVTIIGREIRPLSPQSKSSEAFRRMLYGMGSGLYLRRRRLLLQMSRSDLEASAAKIAAVMDKDSSVTIVCGSDMAKKLKSLKTIALPV